VAGAARVTEAAIALGCAAGIGIGTGLWSREAATGVSAGATLALGVLPLSAVRALMGWLIAKWALAAPSTTWACCPAGHRALPMLLFVTR
jgi:hypothetical protein